MFLRDFRKLFIVLFLFLESFIVRISLIINYIVYRLENSFLEVVKNLIVDGSIKKFPNDTR